MNQHHQHLIDTITAATDSDDALILMRIDDTHTHLERVNCSQTDSMNGALGLLRCTLDSFEDRMDLLAFTAAVASTCAQAMEAATPAEATVEEEGNRA